MSTVKKKKLKIKKKNFAIFIIIIILIVISLTKSIKFINKVLNTPKDTKQVEKVKENKLEKKLKQLNYINKELDYFNNDYIDRYIKYKNKNTNLSLEQVIKNVNMDLDLTKYEDIKKSTHLNTNEILVNKYNYLESDYIPDNLEEISSRYSLSDMNLVSEAKEAFENLSLAAAKESLNIIAMSSYRSYKYQVTLYNNYVKSDGKEKADTYSGRPGHSEHQTGLAVDVYNLKENYTNFENTEEYEWMQEHASEYGFILRFPKDKEEETGYQFESWHYRYVGIEAAKYIKENNISFEEYYATKIKDW
jgi:D-alanyl-D-alanine carboxypeptidase